VNVASEIAWKIVASLAVDALTPEDLAGRFFNSSVNTGLYGQYSVPLKQAYIPLSLQPNTSYDDRIRGLAKAKSYEFNAIKLPYTLEIPELGICRLSLRFRIFAPNIVSITARLKLLDQNLSAIPHESLFKYRNAKSLPHVYDVITWSLGLIGSAATEQVAPAISTRLCVGFHLADVGLAQDIPAYWESSKRQMVGLLIGVEAFAEMGDQIVSAVIQKCEELNLKSTSEHLLVNKQGVIFISPSSGHSYLYRRRFAQAMDLAEIAMVFREFLDNTYPERRRGQEGFLDYTYRVILAWITQPEAILGISYSNRILWQHLSAEYTLAPKLELTKAQNPWLQQEIESASTYFEQFASRWWESPSFAATFPGRAHFQNSPGHSPD
jgi:hypothetical protein